MLSDKSIMWAMKAGNIVIDPFDKRQLGTNSYDCRLGEWYFEQDRRLDVPLYSRVLFSQEVRDLWGEPRQAIDDLIPVRAGATILAHTIEVIGGRNGYLAKMHTRSTVARSGLSVCRCAGVGDVGYIARWTMEISNHTHNTIWLPVGARIAQMVFEFVGETLKPYEGNYGQGTWGPMDMLPSAKSDWAVEEYRATLEQERIGR